VWEERRPSSRCVLNGVDRTTQTIVFVLYEEAMNQYLGMAFYGGAFIASEVSVQAMNHEAVSAFPIRAMMNLVGHWKIMGSSWYFVIHVLLFYIC
jgi:hypothetical protein